MHAYLDGELDPANALVVERRIAADPALAAELARIEALRGALREKLAARSRRLPSARAHRAALGLQRTLGVPSWRALAASVALAMALASGTTCFALRPTPGDHVAEAVSIDTCGADGVAAGRRRVLRSSHRQAVVQRPHPAGAARHRSGAAGFPLVGGRIDVIGRTPVPTLLYRARRI